MTTPELIYPSCFSSFPEVIAAQSTRRGGVSQDSFASLNLSPKVGDNPDHVSENRTAFFRAVKTSETHVVSGTQVHGSAVYVAHTPDTVYGYDAFVTNTPGLMLSVTTADCAPLLLFDPVQRAIAAVHAGWRGAVAGILTETLHSMASQYDSNPNTMTLFIGACIGVERFEVGDDVADRFRAEHKWRNSKTHKWHVDLKSALAHEAKMGGIREERMEMSPLCTVKETKTFFSYRRDGGKTGRLLSVISLVK